MVEYVFVIVVTGGVYISVRYETDVAENSQVAAELQVGLLEGGNE
jgi:hypothetical protein